MRMSQLHVRLTCAVRLYVGFPGDVQQSALIQLSLCGFRYPLLLKLCRTLRRGHFYFNSWNIPSEIQTRKPFPVFSSQVFELTLDANAFIVYIRQMSHSEVPTVILSDFGSAPFPAGCRSPNCSVLEIKSQQQLYTKHRCYICMYICVQMLWFQTKYKSSVYGTGVGCWGGVRRSYTVDCQLAPYSYYMTLVF